MEVPLGFVNLWTKTVAMKKSTSFEPIGDCTQLVTERWPKFGQDYERPQSFMVLWGL